MASPLRFSDLELDLLRYQLRCDGRVVKLERIPMELLIFLVEQRGRLITREEIVQRIWGKDVFVDTENAVNTAVRKIRLALKDDPAKPHFLETVPGKGYRFTAEVSVIAAGPAGAPRETNRQPTLPAGEDRYQPATAAAAAVVSPAVPKRTWLADVLAKASRKTWAVIAGIVAAAALVILWQRPTHVRPASKVMLVVLPLDNLSGDEQQDYLADGVTEEIITELGSLDPAHLGVIARTSAMQYKHTAMNTAEIARELGVAYLLEGSIRRSGNNIRITAQLVQSSDQTHVWAKSYDRELNDVLKVERDIAILVAGEIRLALSQQVKERLAAAARLNPEAHDAYLQGLQGWNQRTPEGFKQAIVGFQRSTELDPGYSPAFAGLARVYALAPVIANVPTSEAVPKALDAVDHALRLDDTLADAHSVLGFIKAHYEYDWPSAQREFRRAIELEPNNALAHLFYSNSYLSPAGRHEEAIAEINKAIELDPLSTGLQSFAGRTFLFARRYDLALAQYQKVNQIDPNFSLNHQRLAQLQALQGKCGEAIAEETKARLLVGEDPEEVVGKMDRLRQAWMANGENGYWRRELELLQGTRNPPEAYERPFGRAIIYGHLGELDKAFANLELAYAQRDTHMTTLAVEPHLDPLRSDPRFANLIRRIRIPTK